jgi:hypothetical protein
MNQLNRTDAKENYGEVIKKGLEVRKAINVLNACLSPGDYPPTLQQERVAIVIFNKFVPSLQAIAMEIRADGPTSVYDLNAMLLANGLDVLPDTQLIESTPEKVEAITESSQGGVCPEASE